VSATNPFSGGSNPSSVTTANPFGAGEPSQGFQQAQVRQLPSYVHISVTTLALLTSAVIAIIPNRPTVEFHGNTTDYLALIGYILTPLLVVLMLALARASDLKRRSNPYFDVLVSIKNLRVLAVLTAVSFGLGTWHIYQFARLYFVK
jgi:hypothetical protein